MRKTTRVIVAVAALAALVFLSYRLVAGPAAPDRSITRQKSGTPGAQTNPGDSAAPAAPAVPARGAVNVPATVLWSEPGRFREHDDLILRENNDPAAWADGMDMSMRLWLVGKAETMVLYGEPVVILERRGEWLKVAAEAQKTTLNEYGYPGWVPASHVTSDGVYLDELKSLPNAAVAEKTAYIFKNEDLTEVLGEVSYMTMLPLLEEKENFVMVRLPGGGAGYMAGSDIKKARELAFSQAGIVEQARQFIGLRYVWAGTAAYGFDCSGFTMRLFQSQGLAIPRDADEQAREGLAVARQDLRPGDLLFYAAQGGLGQIHHVGMYIGDGMMIHSPNSSSAVRTEAVDSAFYGDEYWGARRYVR